jgi:hypothetical protein
VEVGLWLDRNPRPGCGVVTFFNVAYSGGQVVRGE